MKDKPTKPRFLDLTDQRFGMLTVLSYNGRRYTAGGNPISTWLCLCDCGNKTTVDSAPLRRKVAPTKSCGCWTKARLASGGYNRTHGLYNTPEWRAFHAAKARCSSKKGKSYRDYNLRGIKFLFTSVQQLIDEIGLRPSDKYSLDRKDNDGNYEPGNIKWSTRSEQALNRRKTRCRCGCGCC